MTNGIICCVCSTSAISVLQFVLRTWQKDYNTIQERPSHIEIATNDEPYCKGAFEHIILDFKKSGEEKLWKSKSLESAKAEKDRPGQPVVGSDPKTASDSNHEQFIESSFSARYSKWDDNQAWSSQQWKTDTSMCDRSVQPVVTS